MNNEINQEINVDDVVERIYNDDSIPKFIFISVGVGVLDDPWSCVFYKIELKEKLFLYNNFSFLVLKKF